jgi:hypothetical protein
MSYVKDNDDVFLGFELASCRGIGSNAGNAHGDGRERSSESISHGFSFLGASEHPIPLPEGEEGREAVFGLDRTRRPILRAVPGARAQRQDVQRRSARPHVRFCGHRRVSFIGKHGQYLGTVEAPSETAAEAAAVAEFDLSDEQRRRLIASEGN